jgi:hypothetical protein
MVKDLAFRLVYIAPQNFKLELSAEGFQNVLDNPPEPPYLLTIISMLSSINSDFSAD